MEECPKPNVLLVRLKPNILLKLEKLFPIVLLVPGVGAQGGSLSEVCKYGMNGTIGLSINQEGFTHQMELILQKSKSRSLEKCNKKW
jgi:hypothetical protein